jgi:phosphatidylserine decarboxylase
MAAPLLLLTFAFAWAAWRFSSPLIVEGTLVPGVSLGLILYFFRNPLRMPPTEKAGEALIYVSPADGKIAEISLLDHDDFIGGPAIRIGIFLSIFNVHINRIPRTARVIALRYSPGMFLNALRPESALKNENMWIALEEEAEPHRRYIVRQISGAIARRIVCELRPGEVVDTGHAFGMIKLGSRTELILPDDAKVDVRIGQKIQAGTTILARWEGKP